MIKTISFAASRSSSSSSSSRSKAIARSRAKAQPEQPSLAALFPAPEPVAPVSAQQARQELQRAARKTASPAKAEPKARASKPVPTQSVPLPPVVERESAPIKAVKRAPAPEPAREQGVEKAAPSVAHALKKSKAKTKRAAIPVNLAEQYGQNVSKRVESGIPAPVEEEAPKKRLNRAERAARRELMKPDDELRARLQRVHEAVPSRKAEKRPRGWKFECGRCGQTTYFQTNGALCACGALAIKE